MQHKPKTPRLLADLPSWKVHRHSQPTNNRQYKKTSRENICVKDILGYHSWSYPELSRRFCTYYIYRNFLKQGQVKQEVE